MEAVQRSLPVRVPSTADFQADLQERLRATAATDAPDRSTPDSLSIGTGYGPYAVIPVRRESSTESNASISQPPTHAAAQAPCGCDSQLADADLQPAPASCGAASPGVPRDAVEGVAGVTSANCREGADGSAISPGVVPPGTDEGRQEDALGNFQRVDSIPKDSVVSASGRAEDGGERPQSEGLRIGRASPDPETRSLSADRVGLAAASEDAAQSSVPQAALAGPAPGDEGQEGGTAVAVSGGPAVPGEAAMGHTLHVPVTPATGRGKDGQDERDSAGGNRVEAALLCKVHSEDSVDAEDDPPSAAPCSTVADDEGSSEDVPRAWRRFRDVMPQSTDFQEGVASEDSRGIGDEDLGATGAADVIPQSTDFQEGIATEDSRGIENEDVGTTGPADGIPQSTDSQNGPASEGSNGKGREGLDAARSEGNIQQSSDCQNGPAMERCRGEDKEEELGAAGTADDIPQSAHSQKGTTKEESHGEGEGDLGPTRTAVVSQEVVELDNNLASGAPASVSSPRTTRSMSRAISSSPVTRPAKPLGLVSKAPASPLAGPAPPFADTAGKALTSLSPSSRAAKAPAVWAVEAPTSPPSRAALNATRQAGKLSSSPAGRPPLNAGDGVGKASTAPTSPPSRAALNAARQAGKSSASPSGSAPLDAGDGLGKAPALPVSTRQAGKSSASPAAPTPLDAGDGVGKASASPLSTRQAGKFLASPAATAPLNAGDGEGTTPTSPLSTRQAGKSSTSSAAPTPLDAGDAAGKAPTSPLSPAPRATSPLMAAPALPPQAATRSVGTPPSNQRARELRVSHSTRSSAPLPSRSPAKTPSSVPLASRSPAKTPSSVPLPSRSPTKTPDRRPTDPVKTSPQLRYGRMADLVASPQQELPPIGLSNGSGALDGGRTVSPPPAPRNSDTAPAGPATESAPSPKAAALGGANSAPVPAEVPGTAEPDAEGPAAAAGAQPDVEEPGPAQPEGPGTAPSSTVPVAEGGTAPDASLHASGRPKRVPSARASKSPVEPPRVRDPAEGDGEEGDWEENGAAEEDGGPAIDAQQQKHSQAAQLQNIGEAISKPWVVQGAALNDVLWARVKGFPFWPAQVLPEKEIEDRLGTNRKGKEHHLPVMFFGTLEVAWVTRADTCSWSEGVEKGLYSKGHGRRSFQTAVEQVYDFFTPTSKHRRRAPEGWWCKAPPALLDPAGSVRVVQPKKRKNSAALNNMKKLKAGPSRPLVLLDQNGEAGASTQDPVQPAAEQQAQRDTVEAPNAAAVPPASAKPPAQNPEHALLHKAAVDRLPPPATVSPAVKVLRDKKPEYEHVRRNVWVSAERPRRIPKDEISVCSCRPSHRPPLHSAGTWPQALPGRVEAAASSASQRGPSPPNQATSSPAAPNQATSSPAKAAQELATRRFSTGTLAPPAALASEAITNLDDAPLAVLAANSAMMALKAAQAAAESAVPASCEAVQRSSKQQQAAERDGCGENCLNRLSNILCDPRSCPCGDCCSNRPFHLLEGPRMKVFLTENRGWGVQAAEPIKRGSFIVEYAGEVISTLECQRRMRAASEAGEPHFYMMELGPNQVIDARKKGNLARLINSSCDPNCVTQKWTDAATHEVRIGIFAMRNIQPGEELTYDYMFQHSSGAAAAALGYRCMCGAPSCRGTMDLHPERYYKCGRRIEVFWEDGSFYAGTVIGYSAYTRKFTILYDDNDVERVCLESVPHRWLEEARPEVVGAQANGEHALPLDDDMAAALAARVSLAEANAKGKRRTGALGPERLLVKRANSYLSDEPDLKQDDSQNPPAPAQPVRRPGKGKAVKRMASKGLRKPGLPASLEGQATEQDNTLSDTYGGTRELPGNSGPSEGPDLGVPPPEGLEGPPPAPEVSRVGPGASPQGPKRRELDAPLDSHGPHGTKQREMGTPVGGEMSPRGIKRRELETPVGSPRSPKPPLPSKRPRSLAGPRTQQHAVEPSSPSVASLAVAPARHTETRRARPTVSYAVLNGDELPSPTDDPTSPQTQDSTLPRIKSAPRQTRSRRGPAGKARPLAQAAPAARTPDNGAVSSPGLQTPVPAVADSTHRNPPQGLSRHAGHVQQQAVGAAGILPQGLTPQALFAHVQQQALYRCHLYAAMQQLVHANPQGAMADPLVQSMYAQYVCSMQTVPMAQAYFAAMAQAAANVSAPPEAPSAAAPVSPRSEPARPSQPAAAAAASRKAPKQRNSPRAPTSKLSPAPALPDDAALRASSRRKRSPSADAGPELGTAADERGPEGADGPSARSGGESRLSGGSGEAARDAFQPQQGDHSGEGACLGPPGDQKRSPLARQRSIRSTHAAPSPPDGVPRDPGPGALDADQPSLEGRSRPGDAPRGTDVGGDSKEAEATVPQSPAATPRELQAASPQGRGTQTPLRSPASPTDILLRGIHGLKHGARSLWDALMGGNDPSGPASASPRTPSRAAPEGVDDPVRSVAGPLPSLGLVQSGTPSREGAIPEGALSPEAAKGRLGKSPGTSPASRGPLPAAGGIGAKRTASLLTLTRQAAPADETNTASTSRPYPPAGTEANTASSLQGSPGRFTQPRSIKVKGTWPRGELVPRGLEGGDVDPASLSGSRIPDVRLVRSQPRLLVIASSSPAAGSGGGRDDINTQLGDPGSLPRESVVETQTTSGVKRRRAEPRDAKGGTSQSAFGRPSVSGVEPDMSGLLHSNASPPARRRKISSDGVPAVRSRRTPSETTMEVRQDGNPQMLEEEEPRPNPEQMPMTVEEAQPTVDPTQTGMEKAPPNVDPVPMEEEEAQPIGEPVPMVTGEKEEEAQPNNNPVPMVEEEVLPNGEPVPMEEEEEEAWHDTQDLPLDREGAQEGSDAAVSDTMEAQEDVNPMLLDVEELKGGDLVEAMPLSQEEAEGAVDPAASAMEESQDIDPVLLDVGGAQEEVGSAPQDAADPALSDGDDAQEGIDPALLCVEDLKGDIDSAPLVKEGAEGNIDPVASDVEDALEDSDSVRGDKGEASRQDSGPPPQQSPSGLPRVPSSPVPQAALSGSDTEPPAGDKESSLRGSGHMSPEPTGATQPVGSPIPGPALESTNPLQQDTAPHGDQAQAAVHDTSSVDTTRPLVEGAGKLLQRGAPTSPAQDTGSPRQGSAEPDARAFDLGAAAHPAEDVAQQESSEPLVTLSVSARSGSPPDEDAVRSPLETASPGGGTALAWKGARSPPESPGSAGRDLRELDARDGLSAPQDSGSGEDRSVGAGETMHADAPLASLAGPGDQIASIDAACGDQDSAPLPIEA